MDKLSIIAAPATGLGDVARKLLRYLRLDDERRAIDWRRLDGGAHRSAICDLADTLMAVDLRPGEEGLVLLARMYEDTAWESLGIAARMDALHAVLPPWEAEISDLEGVLVAAVEKAKAHPELHALVETSLQAVSRKHDEAEEAAGILPLRRKLDELASRAEALRHEIEAAGLTTIAAVAARLRVLSCDRLMGDDPTSAEGQQLASAIEDLERLGGHGLHRQAAA